MTRAVLAFLLGLALSFGVTVADDKKGDDKKNPDKKQKEKGKGQQATITKIDSKAHTVTVKMKGKDGKTTEKTFKLTETVRYFDSTGKVVAVDVFKSGDYVLVLEADGQLKELRQSKGKKEGDKKK
jgi:hypothetical protein